MALVNQYYGPLPTSFTVALPYWDSYQAAQVYVTQHASLPYSGLVNVNNYGGGVAPATPVIVPYTMNTGFFFLRLLYVVALWSYQIGLSKLPLNGPNVVFGNGNIVLQY
jgi:hypothetical protein